MSALPFISNHLFVAAIGQQPRPRPGHKPPPIRSRPRGDALDPSLHLLDATTPAPERLLRAVPVAVHAESF